MSLQISQVARGRPWGHIVELTVSMVARHGPDGVVGAAPEGLIAALRP